MKKLCKAVAPCAKPLGYGTDTDDAGICDGEKGYSRKRSHRERYRSYKTGKMVTGSMKTLRGTPYVSWCHHGPDGPEGDGAIAWEHLRSRELELIDLEARDWEAPCDHSGTCAYPDYIDGKAPRLPRNTSEILAAIRHRALVAQYSEDIRRARSARLQTEYRAKLQ